jgi:hypothetical protein
MTAELSEFMVAVPDTASRLAIGLGAFLDMCQRPEILRIALTDAPSVLGWATWRAIEAEHGLGLIVELIEQAIAEGMVIAQPPEVLAHLVLSVTMEAALMIASGVDRGAVQPALLTMLSGLLMST